MKVEFLFAWYDLWVGFFWDKKKQWLYILPLPMVGIILKFNSFKSWMAELEQIAFEFSPREYPLGSKWMLSFWKQYYYDEKLSPQEAWDDYTKNVN